MKKISTATLFTFIFLISVTTALAGPLWRSYSITWTDHTPNPRFALYDSGTSGDQLDDLVFDKETGLIWTRDAYLTGGEMYSWANARLSCHNLELGNLKGWRLPTIEELSSLVDTRQAQQPKALPIGHPFINTIVFYWTSTTYESDSAEALMVYLNNGMTFKSPKTEETTLWCVQGGNGYGTGNW